MDDRAQKLKVVLECLTNHYPGLGPRDYCHPSDPKLVAICESGTATQLAAYVHGLPDAQVQELADGCIEVATNEMLAREEACLEA